MSSKKSSPTPSPALSGKSNAMSNKKDDQSVGIAAKTQQLSKTAQEKENEKKDEHNPNNSNENYEGNQDNVNKEKMESRDSRQPSSHQQKIQSNSSKADSRLQQQQNQQPSNHNSQNPSNLQSQSDLSGGRNSSQSKSHSRSQLQEQQLLQMTPEQIQQKAYHLHNKVACPKHPSKSLQYFCQHPECTERLACSSCLLKKQFCRHDISTHIVDIAEFLYEQKLALVMRGLSKDDDIHDYLLNRKARSSDYYQLVNTETSNFLSQVNQMLESIVQTLQELKDNITQQLEEFKDSYKQTEEVMLKKVQESFAGSYLSQFRTFQEVLASKDVSNSIGLKELLEKLAFETGHESKAKEVRRYYDNLISMHDETPELDYSRFEAIRSYFTVFQTKLAQAGPLLITLRKPSSPSHQRSGKDSNPNALLQPLLANLPLSGVKKVAKSADFPSQHSRTIYTVHRLPDRKIITGSDDGSIGLFDLTTFQSLGSYQCHVSGIRSMIVLPNGRLVTGSYDKSIKIWPDPLKFANTELSESKLHVSQFSQNTKKSGNLSSSSSLLQPIKTLTGHTSCIISLKYLNDGATFASGSADYTIRVWDIEKGDNIKSFNGHMSDVLCLECTSTGNTLVSGSSDRTVKVWSLTKKYSSACIKTMTGHTDFIWTICLLQDNVTVLSAGLDKTIKIWDITTGNLLKNLPNQHTSHITKIVQLTKEVVVSCANDGVIKFWDWKSNVSVHSLQLGVGVSTMIVMPDQGLVATGQNKSIYMCD